MQCGLPLRPRACLCPQPVPLPRRPSITVFRQHAQPLPAAGVGHTYHKRPVRRHVLVHASAAAAQQVTAVCRHLSGMACYCQRLPVGVGSYCSSQRFIRLLVKPSMGHAATEVVIHVAADSVPAGAGAGCTTCQLTRQRGHRCRGRNRAAGCGSRRHDRQSGSRCCRRLAAAVYVAARSSTSCSLTCRHTPVQHRGGRLGALAAASLARQPAPLQESVCGRRAPRQPASCCTTCWRQSLIHAA